MGSTLAGSNPAGCGTILMNLVLEHKKDRFVFLHFTLREKLLFVTATGGKKSEKLVARSGGRQDEEKLTIMSYDNNSTLAMIVVHFGE
jgi:hypothetical protein